MVRAARPGALRYGMADIHPDTRATLEEDRRHLLAQIDELTVGGEVDLEYDADFADRGQVASEQGENRSLADAFESQLAQVERALARLDDGTYGTCSVCGSEIGADRLEAIPATDRCIEHA